jgi:hypothetical protein
MNSVSSLIIQYLSLKFILIYRPSYPRCPSYPLHSLILFFISCATALIRLRPPLLRFIDHSITHNTHTHTHSRTPLNMWTARHGGRYLYNTQQTQEMNILVLIGIRTLDLSRYKLIHKISRLQRSDALINIVTELTFLNVCYSHTWLWPVVAGTVLRTVDIQ